MARAKKYYAIKEGRGVKNIILDSWDKCQPLVIGCKAVYKSFKTEEAAKEYLNSTGRKEVKEVKDVAAKAIHPKKAKKAGMISVQTRIPKELHQKFVKRCDMLEMNQTKILQSLIQETFEEWTDDVE